MENVDKNLMKGLFVRRPNKQFKEDQCESPSAAAVGRGGGGDNTNRDDIETPKPSSAATIRAKPEPVSKLHMVQRIMYTNFVQKYKNASSVATNKVAPD